MLLKVTEIEKEILRCAGEVKETGVEGEVCFDLPYGIDLPDFARHMEKAIDRSELDMGCWLRFKEWRDARPGLIEKIRIATFELINGDKPDPTWALR